MRVPGMWQLTGTPACLCAAVAQDRPWRRSGIQVSLSWRVAEGLILCMGGNSVYHRDHFTSAVCDA